MFHENNLPLGNIADELNPSMQTIKKTVKSHSVNMKEGKLQ